MKKKRFTTLLITLCLLLMLPLTAYADVLVEPDNNFYFRNRDECTQLGREFYANGENGSVSLTKAPGSKSEAAVIENGELINIMFVYNHKGQMWGVTELYSQTQSDGKRPTGWVAMDQLLLKYDYISFDEDHADEYYPYTGSYDELKAVDQVITWSWPGSGEAWGYLHLFDEEHYAEFRVEHAYQDEQGREWGYVNYWYGSRNMWICLSDPGNNDIPAIDPLPQPQLWQADDITFVEKGGISVPLLIVILVAVLVVGTGVLIRIFWKPKQAGK